MVRRVIGDLFAENFHFCARVPASPEMHNSPVIWRDLSQNLVTPVPLIECFWSTLVGMTSKSIYCLLYRNPSKWVLSNHTEEELPGVKYILTSHNFLLGFYTNPPKFVMRRNFEFPSDYGSYFVTQLQISGREKQHKKYLSLSTETSQYTSLKVLFNLVLFNKYKELG